METVSSSLPGLRSRWRIRSLLAVMVVLGILVRLYVAKANRPPLRWPRRCSTAGAAPSRDTELSRLAAR
jgi:hypothetical protein